MISPEQLDSLLVEWHRVSRKVDAFFDRVYQAQRAAMRCAPGCSQCCRAELTVTLVEALALLRGLLTLAPDARRRLADDAAPAAAACALLSDDRCLLHAWRPTICRTHGLPVAETSGEIGCCPLNFVDEIPADAVLDGRLLGTMLGVADDLLRQRLRLEASCRIPVRDLVREGGAALPVDVRRQLDAAAML
jgi:hypothetical protein